MGDATSSIIRTFREGIAGVRSDRYLLILEEANHLSITDLDEKSNYISFSLGLYSYALFC